MKQLTLVLLLALTLISCESNKGNTVYRTAGGQIPEPFIIAGYEVKSVEVQRQLDPVDTTGTKVITWYRFIVTQNGKPYYQDVYTKKLFGTFEVGDSIKFCKK